MSERTRAFFIHKRRFSFKTSSTTPAPRVRQAAWMAQSIGPSLPGMGDCAGPEEKDQGQSYRPRLSQPAAPPAAAAASGTADRPEGRRPRRASSSIRSEARESLLISQNGPTGRGAGTRRPGEGAPSPPLLTGPRPQGLGGHQGPHDLAIQPLRGFLEPLGQHGGHVLPGDGQRRSITLPMSVRQLSRHRVGASWALLRGAFTWLLRRRWRLQAARFLSHRSRTE